MKNPVHQRVLKNLFSSSVAQGISIVIQLTLIPLYLKFWGQEVLGQWYLLQSVANWLFISDLGLFGAHATELTLLVSEKRFAEARPLLRSVSTLTFISSFFLLTCLVTLSSLGGFWEKLGISPSANHLSLITFLMCLHHFLMQRTGLLYDIFRAHGQMSRGTHWNTFMRFSEFTLSGVIVILGGQMTQVTFGLVIVRAVGYFAMFRNVRESYSELGFKFFPSLSQAVDLKAVRRLARPSFSFLLFPLADRIKFDGTSLVLGSLFGPPVVSAFNSVRTLANAVYQASALFRTSVLPEFSIAFASKKYDEARVAFLQCLLISFFINAFASLFLLTYGATIYEFWTHKLIHFDPVLLQIFLLSIVLHGVWSNGALPALSVNRHYQISIALVTSSALALLFSSALAFAFSYQAFAIGFLLNELILIPIVFKESLKVLEFKSGDLQITLGRLLKAQGIKVKKA